MISEKKWVAVRCCCTPKKIFGFVQVDQNQGPGVTTLKMDDGSGVALVELKNITLTKIPPPMTAYEFHQLRLVELGPSSKIELAAYSDDRPLEFWRRIEGFVEVQSQREEDYVPLCPAKVY